MSTPVEPIFMLLERIALALERLAPPVSDGKPQTPFPWEKCCARTNNQRKRWERDGEKLKYLFDVMNVGRLNMKSRRMMSGDGIKEIDAIMDSYGLLDEWMST
jgi:hypothetical protein